ncbi:hypothetical protein B0T26DRAFT_631637 [Lasiosphaeria miniovina]|uniref:Cylicin I n=1 Tax=Lasiosphaeria miniovina TaxID=1954250 RepID=A0AA40BGY2_9PEZI|nr:uncharacterized protein B0T26DRAFT_631637 [Lasiosphaeria miniovina]KAK0734052.1 hypothetical protein B0T26DRAFT_631637 [Lasiosphaeria miniovina]
MASSTEATSTGKSYSTDPALYIYTSLTAGSSHIVTATSRLETILRANRVPFKAIDIATDEKARMIWGRRAGKDEGGRPRKLPGLVQSGLVLGDLVEIEDWNEYGELKQHVTIYYDEFTQPPISQAPKTPAAAPVKAAAGSLGSFAAEAAAAAATAASASASASPAPPAPPPAPVPKSASPTVTAPGKTVTLPIRSIAEEAAQKAKQVHLQSLRDKVYGKGGSPTDAESSSPSPAPAAAAATTAKQEDKKKPAEEPKAAAAGTKPAATLRKPTTAPTAAGLQSPTSSGWKDNSAFRLQSPTSTTWQPTDVDGPVTTYLGSVVSQASDEEIAAVERAETIPEEDEDDSEEEEEEEKGKEKEKDKPKK